MNKLNNNKIGLIWGAVFAVWSFAWGLLVWSGQAHLFLNRIFALGFVINPFQIMDFSLAQMIVLVIVSFVKGYIIGWIFSVLVNRMSIIKA